MLSKETKRWLRALGLAKLLFEEQAYHCIYLNEIEDFIMTNITKEMERRQLKNN